MSSTGIKKMGDEFEAFICETTSAKSYGKGDPRGDAYYVYKGKTWNIEVKDNAQNQVRADKNALLIGRDKKTKIIYGAGNLTLLRTIVRGGNGGGFKNGQHTPDALTCMGLGNPNSKAAAKRGMRCYGKHITDEDIESLIEENENHPEIEQLYKEHRQATLDFTQEWQKKAKELLEKIESPASNK